MTPSLPRPAPISTGRAWMQFNVSLRPHDSGVIAARAAVRDAFVDLAERQRRDRAVDAYFWQCKDPGLRLRLRGRDGVADDVTRVLRRLRCDGVVERWRRSVYEPEAWLFGGPAAMGAFHRHATADSRTLSQWNRLPRPFTDTVLSLASLNDLFQRALGGRPEEVWDVWCRLARQHGRATPAQGIGLTPVTLTDLTGHGATQPEALALMRRQMRANDHLSDALGRLWAAGRLTCGLRACLAAIALFHWNRLALAPELRARLLDGMTARLNVHAAA